MLTITITDPPFSFIAETGDTVLNFTVSDQVGPPGPAGTDGAPGGLREVKSASFTAENDTAYTATATLTVTDPTPSQGKGFSVFVRNGTATVGGTAYATAGTIIERIYHSGAWSNYAYQVLPIATASVLGGVKSSDDITVNASTGVATVVTGAGQGSIPRIETGGIIFDTGVVLQFSYSVGLNERTATFQDSNGTVAWLSDIPSLSGYQTTAGTLALGGFSSITGTLPAANISSANLATALNAGTEDTAAADSDRIAVTSPAGGWMSLTTLWTWIAGKLSAAFYRPLIVKESTAQIDVTSSTTYVDITGLTGYSLEADTVYQAVFFGQVTCGASGGYKVQISSSAALFHTASGSHGFGSMNQIGATVGALFQLNSTDIIVNSRTAAGTAAPFMTIFCFRTGASAPTVKFMFAQNASNATTSSLLTGAVGSIQKLI